MKKQLSASIRQMTEEQANAYRAKLLAEKKPRAAKRFEVMWKRVHGKKPGSKQEKVLRFLRLQHLVISLIVVLIVSILVLWVKKVNPVYSLVEKSVKAELAQTFPKPACENPTALLVWNLEGRVYPSTDELHYGRWVEIKQYDQWLKFWTTPEGKAETVSKLTERMLPVSGFDFYSAWERSLDFTLKMGKSCLEVPNPFPTLTARIANAGDVTGVGPESYSPVILPIPNDAAILEDPIPTVIPKPTTLPIPTPTPVGILKFVDEFTKGLEEVRTVCWSKFQPDVVQASACVNIFGRNLRMDNKIEVLANVQNSATSLCSQNLGIVSWNEVVTGVSGIWIYSDTFNAFGEPGNLSLIANTAEGYVCALTQNSTSMFNGKLWLTIPEDPFFPGYGSQTGYGIVSIIPNELSVKTGGVYVWPTK